MKHEDLERIVRSVGMDAGLMSMGAASCIYSEGCEGVTMADFQRLADAIEAHALAQRPEAAGAPPGRYYLTVPETGPWIFETANLNWSAAARELPPGSDVLDVVERAEANAQAAMERGFAAAGAQGAEVDEAIPADFANTDFGRWVVKAYREAFDPNQTFTIHNMAVAYMAGQNRNELRHALAAKRDAASQAALREDTARATGAQGGEHGRAS